MVVDPVGSPISSLYSSGSSDDNTPLKHTTNTAISSSRSGVGGTGAIKFLCSYGGKILPRHSDGRLRYLGGETRVLSVESSISFPELLAKMEELCGWGKGATLRCQLPTMDLDALVSITSDEDLANLLEEYDLADKDSSTSSSSIKIRAFLHFASPSPSPNPKSPRPRSPPIPVRVKNPLSPSTPHRHTLPSPAGFPVRVAAGGVPYHHQQAHHCCNHNHHHHHHQHHQHIGSGGGGGMPSPSAYCRNPHYGYLVHNGNHWQ